MLESRFNKVAGPQACNFIRKRLQHRCFPVKFAIFFRTAILKNVCERLLLLVVVCSSMLLQNWIIKQPVCFKSQKILFVLILFLPTNPKLSRTHVEVYLKLSLTSLMEFFCKIVYDF